MDQEGGWRHIRSALKRCGLKGLVENLKVLSNGVQSADDLANELFIKACGCWNKIAEAKDPEAYLFVVVENHLLWLLRRERGCGCQDLSHKPKCPQPLHDLDRTQAAAEEIGRVWMPERPTELELRDRVEEIKRSLPAGWKRDVLDDCVETELFGTKSAVPDLTPRTGRPEMPIKAACRRRGVTRTRTESFVKELRVLFGLPRRAWNPIVAGSVACPTLAASAIPRVGDDLGLNPEPMWWRAALTIDQIEIRIPGPAYRTRYMRWPVAGPSRRGSSIPPRGHQSVHSAPAITTGAEFDRFWGAVRTEIMEAARRADERQAARAWTRYCSSRTRSGMRGSFSAFSSAFSAAAEVESTRPRRRRDAERHCKLAN